MIDYRGIFLSLTVYLTILGAIFYFLLFTFLPSIKATDSTSVKRVRSERLSEDVRYGNTSNWKYLRTTILEIQGHKCLCCGKSEEGIHVDHILPKSIYPHLEYMIDNLQVLCGACNREKSYIKTTDYRKSNHLISLIRELNENKLLRRKYLYNMAVLRDLARLRFDADFKNVDHPQFLPLS